MDPVARHSKSAPHVSALRLTSLRVQQCLLRRVGLSRFPGVTLASGTVMKCLRSPHQVAEI